TIRGSSSHRLRGRQVAGEHAQVVDVVAVGAPVLACDELAEPAQLIDPARAHGEYSRGFFAGVEQLQVAHLPASGMTSNTSRSAKSVPTQSMTPAMNLFPGRCFPERTRLIC